MIVDVDAETGATSCLQVRLLSWLVVVVAGEEMVPFLSGAHSHTFEIAPTDVET